MTGARLQPDGAVVEGATTTTIIIVLSECRLSAPCGYDGKHQHFVCSMHATCEKRKCFEGAIKPQERWTAPLVCCFGEPWSGTTCRFSPAALNTAVCVFVSYDALGLL